MKIKTLTFVGAAVAAASLTGAATAGLQQVQQQAFGFPLSPGSQQLVFNQFDDNGGLHVLKNVTLIVEATIGANVTAENDSPIDAPLFGVNINGSVTASFGGLFAIVLLNDTQFAPVGPSDGVPGSGPDFHDFGFLSDSGDDTKRANANFAAFIGNGTINADVNGGGGFSVTGSTDSTLVITDFAASGLVTIIYTYNVIPAPGAMALLAAAGLVGVRRRRN